ncbi:hypothetical protein GOV06_02525 [Candidatus Woesearchaeota archaeon]|nr:hypothetical protein [Candidatus Woesearchaeota archaeon]
MTELCLEDAVEKHDGKIQFLGGLTHGMALSSDPIGSLYTHLTDNITLGGFAVKIVEADPRLDSESTYYKLGKAVGVVGAGAMQIMSMGGAQAVLLAGDVGVQVNLRMYGMNKFNSRCYIQEDE